MANVVGACVFIPMFVATFEVFLRVFLIKPLLHSHALETLCYVPGCLSSQYPMRTHGIIVNWIFFFYFFRDWNS